MKQNILLLFVAIFFIQNIQAQVPGYQGKRFFAEIGGSFFPNFGSLTAQNKGANSFPFGANTGQFIMKDRYSLSLHYVIGRLTTFKIAYNYQVAGNYATATTRSLIMSGLDYHDLFYQLHFHDVNLGFNLYGKRRSSNLAPMGFYWDLGVRLIFTQGVLRDQRVTYADNRPDNTPIAEQLNPLPDESFTFLFGITGMWGYRTVIADRLILNFGIETTLFAQYPLAMVGFPLARNNPSETLSSYQKGVIKTAQDRYLLSIHIGIGALIF